MSINREMELINTGEAEVCRRRAVGVKRFLMTRGNGVRLTGGWESWVVLAAALVVLVFAIRPGYIPVRAAGAPDVEWERVLGRKLADRGSFAQPTADGGYLVVGWSQSYYMHGRGGSDVYLVKTDGRGYQQWDMTAGDSGDQAGACLQPTEDGGFIVVGTTNVYGRSGIEDVYLAKIDASGHCQWEKTLGGDYEDQGVSVQQTRDGGYIIAGSTDRLGTGDTDILLIKTDARGNQEWRRYFGGREADRASCVVQVEDGGYIAAGATASMGKGGFDIYLVKTDAAGKVQWQKTYGGRSDDEAFSIQATSGGGFIVAGQTFSYGNGSSDIYLVKVNRFGGLEWQKALGGTGWDAGYSVCPVKGGGYIVAGATGSYGAGDYDVYLVRTDTRGVQLWDKTLGGAGCDEARWVGQARDGGYVVAGWTNSFGPERIYDYKRVFDYDQIYLARLKPESIDPVLERVDGLLPINRGTEHTPVPG